MLAAFRGDLPCSLGRLHTRLHQAGCVMQLTVDYAEQFTRLGDRLWPEPITEGALRGRVLDRLLAIEEGVPKRSARNREQAKRAIMAIFLGHGRGGRHARERPGSKWCATNTNAEHADFGPRYTTRSNQVRRSFEDSQLKQNGLGLVLAA